MTDWTHDVAVIARNAASAAQGAVLVAGLVAVACGGCGGSESGGPERSAASRTFAPEVVSDMNRAVGLMGRFEFEAAAAAFERLSTAPDAPAVPV